MARTVAQGQAATSHKHKRQRTAEAEPTALHMQWVQVYRTVSTALCRWSVAQPGAQPELPSLLFL